jgi:hypothetical protein
MARGSGFGALGKNFIIVGNAQHRIWIEVRLFDLRDYELPLRAHTSA